MGLGGMIIGALIGSFAGPWGAAIGAGIGAWATSSKRQEKASVNLLILLFRALGKLAKSDGVVSQEEADVVKAFLHSLDLPEENRQVLCQAFAEGKTAPESMEEMIEAVAMAAPGEMYPAIMEIFCTVVLADGVLSPDETRFLNAAERILHLPGWSARFFREHGGQSQGGSDYRRSSSSSSSSGAATGTSALTEAYQRLGIPSSATDAEVKKAWHRKVQEFHPDRLQGKGLSDSFLQFANSEMQKINDAYEAIRRTRGM